MLANLADLLARQGAGTRDIASAVTYLRRAEDREAFLDVARGAGFPAGVPHTVCVADVCRRDWLFESRPPPSSAPHDDRAVAASRRSASERRHAHGPGTGMGRGSTGAIRRALVDWCGVHWAALKLRLTIFSLIDVIAALLLV